MPFLRIISKMETRPVNFLDENKTLHSKYESLKSKQKCDDKDFKKKAKKRPPQSSNWDYKKS